MAHATATNDRIAPTADRLWFLDGLVTVHMAQAGNAAGASLMEHRLPEGFSPPFHVHHHEDETFYVLAGAFRFHAGDTVRAAGAGEVVHIPAGVPHSFRVTSAGGGRCLTLTHGGFEAMVRELSRPAPGDTLPARTVPSPALQARLAAAAARHGIAILGAPLA